MLKIKVTLPDGGILISGDFEKTQYGYDINGEGYQEKLGNKFELLNDGLDGYTPPKTRLSVDQLDDVVTFLMREMGVLI